jgi:transcriptional regulator with XRE-family HTH domain
MTMTGSQLYAARILLGWPRLQLADEVGVELSQFASFEAYRSELPSLQLLLLQRKFEAAGIVFDEDGEHVTIRDRK